MIDAQNAGLLFLLLVLVAFEFKTSTGRKHTQKVVSEAKTVQRRKAV